MLHRLTGAVCEHLSGRSDAQLILESIAARNLFLVRLEGRNGWYRHHRLFGEFLRHRLAMDDPIRARRAGLQAAAWFRGHGDATTALHHLVHADGCDQAVARAASSRAHEPAAGCPNHGPTGSAGAQDDECSRLYTVAAALLHAGRAHAGVRWLRSLEVAAGDRPDGRAWRTGIDFLWGLHAALAGDAAHVLRQCGRVRRARSQIGPIPPIPPELSGADGLAQFPFDPSLSREIAVLAARAHLWLDQPERARAALADPVRWDGISDDPAGLGIRALLACRSGQLHEAYRLANSAREEAERGQPWPVLAVLDSYLAMGTVLWERHALDGAARRLEQALESAGDTATPPASWPLECLLIRVMISQGRGTEALGRIAVLRTLDRQAQCPAPVRPALAVLEGRCWYLLGDRHRALRALGTLPPRYRRSEVLAWADLWAGWPDRAAARLNAPPDQPVDPGRELRRMTLLARAQVQLGDEREAMATLHRALDAAGRRVLVRVRRAGPRLLAGLQRIAGRIPMRTWRRSSLMARRARRATGRTAVEVVQLSTREREILALSPEPSISGRDRQ